MPVEGSLRWLLDCCVTTLSPGDGTLKKLIILLTSVVVLLIPHSAFAEYHRHIRGTEMAGIGVALAALIGVAGYLVLRHRHSVDD